MTEQTITNKANIMFLPKGYSEPKSTGSYTKLLDGDTKIRILSAPIIGWEDWIEKKPIRYRMDQKPPTSFDEEKPLKHFWSMIIWNYTTDQLEIFHITQASIRKEIANLSKSEDWGAPYFYDMRITKKGEGMKTEYGVTPIPHKPLPEKAKLEFYKRPCNLEALFDNGDPFDNSHKTFTEGVFDKGDEVKQEVKPSFISDEQSKMINELLNFDTKFKSETVKKLNKMGIKSVEEISLESFDRIYSSIYTQVEQLKQKEMELIQAQVS